jgi:CRISPR/Cas system-associated protein endoribonuclease Cas2
MKKQDMSIRTTGDKYFVFVGADPPGGLGFGTSRSFNPVGKNPDSSSIFTCPVGVGPLPVVYKLKPSKGFSFPVGKKSKSSKAFARPVDLKSKTSNCFSFPVGPEWLTTSLTSEMIGSRAETKLLYGSFSRNENVEYPISNIEYSIINNNRSGKSTWVDNRISVALCDFSVYSVVKRKESSMENHKENTKEHEERTKNFNAVRKEYPISNIQYSVFNTQNRRNVWDNNTTSVALCDLSVYSVVKREESTTENHKENTKDHEERTKSFDVVENKYPISNIQYSIINNQNRKNTWVDNRISVALCGFSVVKREDSTTENHKENTKEHEERTKSFNAVENKYPISNIQYSILNIQSKRNTLIDNKISVALCDFSVFSVVKLIISNEQQATKYYKQSLHLPRGGFNSGDRPGAAAITIYSLFSSPRGTSCFAGSKRLAHKRSLPVINQQAFHQGSIVLPDKGDKIRFSESGGPETYPDYRMKGFKTRKEVCRDIN